MTHGFQSSVVARSMPWDRASISLLKTSRKPCRDLGLDQQLVYLCWSSHSCREPVDSTSSAELWTMFRKHRKKHTSLSN
jgi:hypothetical protein